MTKYIYQIMDGNDNCNTIGLFDNKDLAIKEARKFYPRSVGKEVQVNRIELNELTFCSESFDVVWEMDEQMQEKYLK